MKKKHIFDIILILSLLFVFIIILLVTNSEKGNGEAVRVSVDGEVKFEYSLEINGEYELNGGTNLLIIKDGFAYIKHAECKDQVCVRMGKISKVGQRIICLPNKILIEVVGEGEEIL